MFIRRRTKKIMATVVPLLEDLYPEKTQEQRASILTLFGAAHEGRAIVDLEESHLRELEKTLRYWARVRTLEGVLDPDADTEWPGIDDVCAGCLDFKAAMLDLHADITTKTDLEGHVLSPIQFDETDQHGKPLSQGFREWLAFGDQNK